MNRDLVYPASGRRDGGSSSGVDKRRAGQSHTSEKSSDQLIQPLVITRAEGGIRSAICYASPAFISLLGCDAGDLIGKPYVELVSFEETTKARIERLGNISGREAVGEFNCLRKDGMVFRVQVSVSPLHDMEGRLTHLLWHHLVLKRNELQANSNELKPPLIDEAELSALHDLGQPLGVIATNTAMAKHLASKCPHCRNAVSEVLEDVVDDLKRVREIIHSVRSHVKHRQSLRQATDLNAVVSEALRLVRQDCDFKQITLVAQFSQSSCVAFVDRLQIQTAIVNLLKNAIEAVESQAKARRVVEITVQEAGNGNAEIVVSDHGEGIAPEQVPRLFSPFFTTKPQGIGLGLRLSRSIAEAHGGKIEVTSAAVGAEFRLRLPRFPVQSR